MKILFKGLIFIVIIFSLSSCGAPREQGNGTYEKSSADFTEKDYEYFTYLLENQAQNILELLRNTNGKPLYKINETSDIEYIEISNDWFNKNNENSKIELITLGYVLKESDTSTTLTVEGMIFDPSVYDQDPEGIVVTGEIPFKYVQFRLMKQDEAWVVTDYIDSF